MFTTSGYQNLQFASAQIHDRYWDWHGCATFEDSPFVQVQVWWVNQSVFRDVSCYSPFWFNFGFNLKKFEMNKIRQVNQKMNQTKVNETE